MFHNEKLLYDTELTVPTSMTGENYTGTPNLVLFNFKNSSKI